MIEYHVAPQCTAHLFEVRLIVHQPDEKGQQFSLPRWIPGSYLIRDFARHIVSIKAFAGDMALLIDKINSNTWQCQPTSGPITLIYQVYAWDRSVRGAHLDTTHAFFNGCCLFLKVIGQENRPCRVNLLPFDKTWQVATTLPRDSAPLKGYGWYKAASYESLIDHPVEIGRLSFQTFTIDTIDHTIAVNEGFAFDFERLCHDVAKICRIHMRLFADTPPFDCYLFLVAILKKGYGGLEHANASALMLSKESLPALGEKTLTTSYIETLGLFSHEYFHAWHIKRIKPRCFMPYNLDKEVYTRQLWIFEGFTTYYEYLALVRAKLISVDQYLDILARMLTTLLRTPGREKQTLVEASFDAWIKLYQPNENTHNVTVSYYLKGAIVALMIDLALRIQSQHRLSLDDVMRKLWQDYGKVNRGLFEGEVEALIKRLGGDFVGKLLQKALYTTEEIDLAPLLAPFGLALVLRAAVDEKDKGGVTTMPPLKADCGCTFSLQQGRVFIARVLSGGAAEKGGLCPQDEIVAIDGWQVKADIFTLRQSFEAGQRVVFTIFRQEQLKVCELTLAPPALDTVEIRVVEEQKQSLQQWLTII